MLQSSNLQQVRKAAHEELLQVASRITTRGRQNSINASIERGIMGGSMSPRPIIDPRCQEDASTLLSPILKNKNGVPLQLLQTKVIVAGMVTKRVQQHRAAELAIQQAEDALEARGGAMRPVELANRINQSLMPLESQHNTTKIQRQVHQKSMVIGALSGFVSAGTSAQKKMFSPKKEKAKNLAQDRMNKIERTIAELEEYSVSTPEMKAATQMLFNKIEFRSHKSHQELLDLKSIVLTKDDAQSLYQTKKNNTQMLERLYEMATNKVRTVIGSEVRSILKNEWNDMMGKSQPPLLPDNDSLTTDKKKAAAKRSFKEVTNDSNVTVTEIDLCFSQHRETDEFYDELHHLLVRMVKTQQKRPSAVVPSPSVGSGSGGSGGGSGGGRSGGGGESGGGGAGDGGSKINTNIKQLQKEMKELKEQLQVVGTEATSTKKLANEINIALEKRDNETHETFVSIQDQLTQVHEEMEGMKGGEEDKEDEFQNEREKLIAEHKKQIGLLNEMVEQVHGKAEDIRKLGLRMEQKVERVVSDAAAKLEQTTKNEIVTEVTRLEVKTKYDLEQTKVKLQSEIRTKILKIEKKVGADEKSLRACVLSLPHIERLNVDVAELTSFSNTQCEKQMADGKRLLDIQRWIDDTATNSLSEERNHQDATNQRLLMLERRTEETTATLNRTKRDQKSLWTSNAIKMTDTKKALSLISSTCKVKISVAAYFCFSLIFISN